MGCTGSKHPINAECATHTVQDNPEASTGEVDPQHASRIVEGCAHSDTFDASGGGAAAAGVAPAPAEQKQPPSLEAVSNAQQPRKHSRSHIEKRKASASSLHNARPTSGRAFTKWAIQQAARTGQSLEEYVSGNLGTAALADGGSSSSSGASGSRGHSRSGFAFSSSSACILVPFEPHDAAPRPPCSAERQATAAAIARAHSADKGELESVLGAVCKALDVESASIVLHVGDTEHTLAACGCLSVPSTQASSGFCGWTFASSNHELLVLEDARQDARLSGNTCVLNQDGQLTSYMGAPLISMDGHRIGTLCIMGRQPLNCDAMRAQFLTNMAELLMRQLERAWVMQSCETVQQDGEQQQQQQQQEWQEEQKVPCCSRHLACYDAAHMLVDATSWRVIYMNKAAERQLGTEWRFGVGDLPTVVEGTRYPLNLGGVSLASYFELHRSCAKWQPFGRGFDVSGVSSTQGQEVTLNFRPATSDGLDAWQPFSVGIPAWLPTARDSFGQNLFFLRISTPDTATHDAAAPQNGSLPGPSQSNTSAQSASYISSSPFLSSSAVLAWWTRVLRASSGSASLVPRGLCPTDCPIPGLVLGPLLGKGSHGRVYRGVFKGMPVAAKIIKDVSSLRTIATGELQEAVLTQGLHHTGIMRTITYACPADGSTCWVLYEYCNLSCLQDAVLKGMFCTSKHTTKGGADLLAVAATAHEVASAMAFLHKHDIVHGALKAGNVMLCSSSSNLHHFQAKVGDFCVARDASFRPHCPSNAYDSIAHLPPETLLNCAFGKPADVYSFGVLLWEMLTGSRAWAGLSHAQIICQVALVQRQLATPEGLPIGLAKMLRSCLALQPARRCTFEEVLGVLWEYLHGGATGGEQQ